MLTINSVYLTRQLFINACILITVLFLASEIFKTTGLHKKSAVKIQLAAGVIGGICGILLITFSVNITTGIILDFRYVPVIIVAMFTSFYIPFITAAMIAVFRIIYLGVTQVSLYAAITMLIIAAGCAIISSLKLSRPKRWTSMFVYSVASYSILLAIVIKDRALLAETLTSFWIGSVFVNILVFLVTDNLYNSFVYIERLKDESTTDFLTGLNNVRTFDLQLNKYVQEALLRGNRLSVLMLDIDHFKRINDTYGHPTGDLVLRELALILKDTCSKLGFISRMGGEEFSVLLPGITSIEAIRIAENLRQTVCLNEFTSTEGKKIKVTTSIGVATYDETVKNIDDIMEKADNELYRAKQSGRNKVCA